MVLKNLRNFGSDDHKLKTIKIGVLVQQRNHKEWRHGHKNVSIFLKCHINKSPIIIL